MQRQENAIKKWWWVITFILCVFGAYIHGIREKKQAIQNLALRLEEMQQEKMARLQEKEELTLQLASQNDPAWIEMVLMRDLGLVPEGWLKVHFKK